MHIVARNIGEVFTRPITFATNAGGAAQYLNAPCRLVDVYVSHKKFCKVTPFECETSEDAHQLRDNLDEYLVKTKGELPVHGSFSTQLPHPARISHRVTGKSKVYLKAFVIKQDLPIGRSLKEAQQDPLGEWNIAKRHPQFENEPLRIKSHLLPQKYKTRAGFDRKFEKLVLQRIVKCVESDGLFRARYRYLKAPRVTFERDRMRIIEGMEKPLTDPSKPRSFEGYELRDLFNRNVILVTEEGDGRSMSSNS